MSDKIKTDPQEQARILSEALPYMQRYDEETIVVKYGGHAMGDDSVARALSCLVVSAFALMSESGVWGGRAKSSRCPRPCPRRRYC